ncbi:hypothetical protein PR202_gb27051 [Eleusine coracana subsp. coracana]|uniref:non-specific serine/threonine protein kinase n=1 Tax=Eleusine coracana subsp. coracana TaxID=191504 RepID=A0AAV5FT80_ELECO|nr:hypothetical protein PR202_gb27051 [Eleusine coracana subsp. coracana]
MSALCFHLFFLTSACLALLIRCQVDYQHGPPSSANLSTVWKMSGADPTAGSFGTQYAANPVLLRSIAAPEYRNLYFGAGFYCVTPCNTFVFGVYAVSTVNQSDAYKLNANANSVMLVWSANRDHQVQKSATLNFTGDGDLILRDADGSLVWSSGTSGRSVVGMNMTESGNLVLFDQDNKSVWQSFDHPVDSLLPGQRLLVGKSLTPSTSSTINMTTSNQFYLTVRPDGLYLYAFVGYQVPRLYYSITTDQFMAMSGRNDRLRYISLKNGSLAASFPASTKDAIFFLLPTSQWLQFMRFDSDGRLRLYEWSSQSQLSWTAQDILELDNCDYPFVRGDYGICSNGQCSCPMPGSSAIGSYFRQVDDQKTNPGCILDTPISCQQSIEDHQLILVHNVSDFNYVDRSTGVITDEESCKQACLGNCSCKAALFRYDNDASNGSCLLASESLSLVGSSTGSAFLKVDFTNIVHGLPPNDALALGPFNPNDQRMIYVRQGGVLFAVDMEERQLLGSNFHYDRLLHLAEDLHPSFFVKAWDL